MKDEVAFVTLWTLKRSRNRVKIAFSVEKSQMDHEGLPRGSLSPAPRLRFRGRGSSATVASTFISPQCHLGLGKCHRCVYPVRRLRHSNLAWTMSRQPDRRHRWLYLFARVQLTLGCGGLCWGPASAGFMLWGSAEVIWC